MINNISRFLCVALALISVNAYSAPVATTAGSNLTAYNPAFGSNNNNAWNSLTNVRSMGDSGNVVDNSAPVADFGNCNALILRCVQPKCATGGCTTLDIARPIVAGCVEDNQVCKQYGNTLIDTLAAQVVANTVAKSNQQATAAQNNAMQAEMQAAAQAAAQQSAQQIQAMQEQMQAMQEQMAQQNAETAAMLQEALSAQQQSASSVQAPSVSNTTAATASDGDSVSAGLTAAQQIAAASGVSADVLAREQIAGQILSQIENAEVSLKELRATLNDVYNYAGCDSSGNNCTGPKRVKTFKEKAMNFFEPYNNVLDELYEGLILAQSVGVDITDIYMMLNGTCNVWGLYLCAPGQVMFYNTLNCPDGRSVPTRTAEGFVLGNAKCTVGHVVPMSDGGCQLIKMLTNNDDVQKSWLYPEVEPADDKATVRVGCASEALDNSSLFSNRKKQASIDIETLQRIIEQDAPTSYGRSVWGGTKNPETDGIIYCKVTDKTYDDLQKLVSLKRLPDKVCVTETQMTQISTDGNVVYSEDTEENNVFIMCAKARTNDEYKRCLCENCSSNLSTKWNATNKTCECDDKTYNTFDYDVAACINSAGQEMPTMFDIQEEPWKQRKAFCNAFNGAKWDSVKNTCDCTGVTGNDSIWCKIQTQ